MPIRATFSHKTLLAPYIWEFFVQPAARLDYQPGQYIDVTLPRVADKRSPSRVFTLTSLPDEQYLRFVVKFPSPHSAYKAALLQLASGDTLQISQAMGDLVLPRDKSRPLVFVAGGLGIASFVSMCRWLTVSRQARDISLLYAVHSKEEELFVRETAVCPGLSKQLFVSPNRLGTDNILAAGTPNSLYYISGSEPFTMGFRTQLIEQGTNPTNIAYDFFDGYKPADI